MNSLGIDVGTGAAMLPVAAANDPDPQTPQEIALATGPLRRLAAATFDDSSKMPNTAMQPHLQVMCHSPAYADG